MPSICTMGDLTNGGGILIASSKTVRVNGKPVGLEHDKITPHPGGKKHKVAKAVKGSSTVFIDGKPALKTGSRCSCGHTLIGKANVNIS